MAFRSSAKSSDLFDNRQTKRLVIAIIGFNPRGLTILERIWSLTDDDRLPIIHIIDPRKVFGSGVHPSNQPAYLWVNTVAEQITMFPDDSVDPLLFGPITKGLP